MLTIIIYVVLVVLIILDYVKDKFLITPIKTFNFVWLCVMFFYNFKLSNIQQDFSERTLLIFLVCILSFDIVSMFMRRIKVSNKQHLDKQSNVEKSNTAGIKYTNTIIVINIIFILAFGVEILYSRGFPLLWQLTGIGKTYIDFGIPSFHGMLNGLAICMGTILLFKKNNYSKYIYILYGILIISRQVLISMFVQAIVYNIILNIKEKRKINYKKYIVILLIIFILFSAIGNFRSGDVMKNNFAPKEKYENMPISIMWIYSYLFFSFSNFNNLVSITDGGINHGASTINFLIPTALTSILEIEEEYKPYYLVSPCFTVSTYLPELYLDFGIVGIGVFNVIIAIITTYVYKKMRCTNNEKWIILYSVFIHNIVLLLFTNMFLYLPIIIQYVYILLMYRKERIRKEEL